MRSKFDTFTWADNGVEQCIDDVLQQFDRYCQPRMQAIYERHKFKNRNQAVDESIYAFVTDLRTIAKNCPHEEITPDEITRKRFALGVTDKKIRKRLLRINDVSISALSRPKKSVVCPT